MKSKIVIISSAMLLAIGGVIYGVKQSNASSNCPMTPECPTPAHCEKATSCPMIGDCCKK